MFRVWRVFKYDFVTNYLLSLTVKEIWKSVNRGLFGEVMGNTLVSFLTHSVPHIQYLSFKHFRIYTTSFAI